MISNFKYHMTNRFAGCVHIATTHDPYRNRVVQIFAMPGDFELVGIYDGVDRWVAPVSAEPFVNFGVKVKALLESLRAGTFQRPVESTAARRRITLDPDPTPRRPMIQATEDKPRRRMINV